MFVAYGLGGWICVFGLFVFSCDFVNSVAIVLFFVLGSFSVGSCYLLFHWVCVAGSWFVCMVFTSLVWVACFNLSWLLQVLFMGL